MYQYLLEVNHWDPEGSGDLNIFFKTCWVDDLTIARPNGQFI